MPRPPNPGVVGDGTTTLPVACTYKENGGGGGDKIETYFQNDRSKESFVSFFFPPV